MTSRALREARDVVSELEDAADRLARIRARNNFARMIRHAMGGGTNGNNRVV